MWRLSWIIGVGPSCHHKCPSKRDLGVCEDRRGEGHVTMEAGHGVMQPRVKECDSTNGGGGKGPLEPLEGRSPAHALILTQRY